MAKTTTTKLSYARISALFQTLNKVISYSAFDLSTLQSIGLKKELLKKLEIYDEARKQILEQTGKLNKELNKYEFPTPEEESKAVELVTELNNKEESNYMQVGDMTACGHCQRDKFQPVMPCECICHGQIAMANGVNDRLTFETREEAREYCIKWICKNSLADEKILSIMPQVTDSIFNQWLSEEKVTILSELKQ